MIRQEILGSKRLQSLELQIFTYVRFLKEERATIQKIRDALLGIASVDTIKKIVDNSPFFIVENNHVSTAESNHIADIIYDFDPHNPNAELTISGKNAPKGTGKLLQGVELKGIAYRLQVKVLHPGVGNWKLNIKKIKVTDRGDEHERRMESNPLTENGNHNWAYDTHPA